VIKKIIPPWLQSCCYYVSAVGCRDLQVLRFAYMRDEAMKQLREMKNKYRVGILNFFLYPEGFRILLNADHPGQVSDAIRFFKGVTAQHWLRQKGGEGPVWRPRYNLTLVEKGAQAIRCGLDMDFTMARSGDPDWFHPLLWKHSGHHDLTGARKRYRVVDLDIIERCFAPLDVKTFQQWYIDAVCRKYDSGEYGAEPWWEQALAVGSKELCEDIADTLPRSRFNLKFYPPPASIPDMKKAFSYTIVTSKKHKRDYILRYKQ